MTTMTKYYSLTEAAKQIGVRSHRLAYAVASGLLPEPAQRMANHRMFSPSDIEAAKKFFSNPQRAGRPLVKEPNAK